MGSFFYLYSKKKMILPQKELDYMWPLISGLGQFNAHYGDSHDLSPVNNDLTEEIYYFEDLPNETQSFMTHERFGVDQYLGNK